MYMITGILNGVATVLFNPNPFPFAKIQEMYISQLDELKMNIYIPLTNFAPYLWIVFFLVSAGFWWWVLKRNAHRIVKVELSIQELPFRFPFIVAAMAILFNLVTVGIMLLKLAWRSF